MKRVEKEETRVGRYSRFVALVLVVAACAGGEVSAETTTSAPEVVTTTEAPITTSITSATTTTTTLSADVEIAAVLSALEAKNSFDLDGWLAAFEGGRRGGVPIFAEEILMNAEERWEVIEPCQVTGETTSGDTVVECLIHEITTSYWGVGGISGTKVVRFAVNTDGLISTSDHFGSARKNSFNTAFHQWLSDTYPDVYNEMGYGSISSNAPGFDTRNPDHMLVAVEYVEEFVAQSDEYPLDPTDQ